MASRARSTSLLESSTPAGSSRSACGAALETECGPHQMAATSATALTRRSRPRSLVSGPFSTSRPGHGWTTAVTTNGYGLLPTEPRRSAVAGRTRSFRPTRQEVGPETLGERLSAELVAHDGIMITGPLVGAWTTKP